MDTPSAEHDDSSLLTVIVEVDANVATIDLVGELDLESAEQLDRAIQNALDQGVSSFVFECDGLTYVGSTGVRCMVDGAHRAAERNGTTTIRNASTTFRRILEITGVDALVVIA